METANDHWSSQRARSPATSKHANATNRRNADRERELQRLKSLGVVSVLNKTFDSQDNLLAPAPIPSPSSSTSSSPMLTERGPPKPMLSTSSSSRTSIHLQDDDSNIIIPVKKQYRPPAGGESPLHQQGGENHWVMAILPAEQGEPRIYLDENGNPMTVTDALEGDKTSMTCEHDNDQLFHIDNHPSLVDHHLRTTQLLQQTQQLLASSQSQQKQMEQDTKQTLEQWLGLKETDSIKVQQLSQVILKQDQVIHELESTLSSVLSDNEQLRQGNNDNNDSEDHSANQVGMDDSKAVTKQELAVLRKELADLQVHKASYEQMIVTLCSELESSQDETRKLTLLTNSLNQQCQQQQEQIDGKIGTLLQQLADKDILVRKYRDRYSGNLGDHRQDLQQQQQQRHSLLVNDNATTHSAVSTSSSGISMTFSEHDINFARYSSASSYSRSSIRANNNKQRHSRNSLPRRKGKTGANVVSWPNSYIPPPSGPPPSIPLPPLPIVDDDQVDPELKHMTNTAPLSDDEIDDQLQDEQHALTSSLEQLLLQAPSGYTLDDDTALNETYREFTEQLQSRLSMPKELDHLKLWDHEALERLRQQQMAVTRRRPSHAPTNHTTASTSSQWSAASSSVLGANGDQDDQQHHDNQPHGRDNSAFWKGMKKKLHV